MTVDALGHKLLTTDQIPFNYQTNADIFLGVVIISCFVIGLPTNLFALHYFIDQRQTLNTKRQFFNTLYIWITVNDIFICSTAFPVAISLFGNRNPITFENTIFCSTWAILWELLPYMSVFLVGILSISRMLTVLYPLKELKAAGIRIAVVFYLLLLTGLKAMPIFMHLSSPSHQNHSNHDVFRYNKHSVYCFLYARTAENSPESGKSNTAWETYGSVCSIFMACPIIPIIASCFVSIYKILISKRRSKNMNSCRSIQRRATITVVIVTLTYVIYNIPVFCNYVAWSVASFSPQTDYKDIYNGAFLYWYSWVLTYVVCVSMNSSTNPLVYYFRMAGFKKYVYKKVTGAEITRVQEEVESPENGNGPLFKFQDIKILHFSAGYNKGDKSDKSNGIRHSTV